MALQAAASLISLTGLAGVAATLFALAALWWALGVRGSPLMSAKERKQQPRAADVSPSLPEAEPTDADLGIGLAAFLTSTERHCDAVLLGLCDSAVDGLLLQSLEEDFRGQTSLEDQADSEDMEAVLLRPLGGAATGEPLARPDADLGVDFEAFQAHVGHHCDLALDALCESAMDEQSARVLDDLEHELAGVPTLPGRPPPRAGTPAEPEATESGSGGSSTLEDETQELTFNVKEIEEELSRQIAEDSAMETRTLGTDGAFEVAVEEYNQWLLCELASENQQLPCINSLEIIIERIRKACEFILWVI